MKRRDSSHRSRSRRMPFPVGSAIGRTKASSKGNPYRSILRELCFYRIMLQLECIERLLNAFPEMIHRLSFARENRITEVNVDRGKGFGDLQAVPSAFQEPSSRRHGDHVQHNSSGSLGQQRDSFVNPIPGTPWAVDGEESRPPTLEMVDQCGEGGVPTVVPPSLVRRPPHRDNPSSTQTGDDNSAVDRSRNHRSRSWLAIDDRDHLMCMQNRVDVRSCLGAKVGSGIVVAANATGRAATQWQALRTTRPRAEISS